MKIASSLYLNHLFGLWKHYKQPCAEHDEKYHPQCKRSGEMCESVTGVPLQLDGDQKASTLSRDNTQDGERK